MTTVEKPTGSRSGAIAGLTFAAFVLGGLCLVPVGVWSALGLFGRTPPPPVAPIDPSTFAGMGTGGPHMPADLASVPLLPVPDTKVIWLEVVSVRAARFAHAGDRCRLEATYDPSREERACRLVVTCGDTVVYGSDTSGEYTCEPSRTAPDLRTGADESPSAEDGTPRLAVGGVEVTITGDRGGPLGDFDLVLSRTAAPPTPPDLVLIEPIFYPEGATIL